MAATPWLHTLTLTVFSTDLTANLTVTDPDDSAAGYVGSSVTFSNKVTAAASITPTAGTSLATAAKFVTAFTGGYVISFILVKPTSGPLTVSGTVMPAYVATPSQIQYLKRIESAEIQSITLAALTAAATLVGRV